MRFIFVFLSLSICNFAFGQIEECPCEPTAIICPCPSPPSDYEPPIPPPAPIPQCGDISDYPTGGDFDSDEFMSGFEDGRDQTMAFIQLSLAGCEYSFAGGSIGAVLGSNVTPNPEWVIDPSEPQMVSIPGFDPYVQDGSEIVIASGGHDPGCVEGLNGYLMQLSGIIADKIDQEIASPGSTGHSLSYWLGFCSGFGMSAGSW